MMLRKTPLCLCLLVIGFASCKKANVVPTNSNKGKNLVLTSFEEQKVTADNAFTLKLFKNLNSANTGSGNLFVSPLSVSFALGMTSNGANGQTLTAFKNTLNFSGLTQDQVNTYYNNLITNLPQLDPNTTLKIANSIWYRNGFNVLPQFLQTDSSYFHAKIQALDFSNPASAGIINSWVSANTGGKIPSIIDQIPADDVMYLINAIYFKSTWREKFDQAQTQTKPFYVTPNSTIQASFMTGTIDFNVYFDNNTNVFEIPYSDSKYSMVIVMPANKSASVNDLIAGIDSALWQTWMAHLSPVKAAITLPKFKFSYSAILNNTLANLGLGKAFSDNADFSLINPDPTLHLKISKVVHKAFVETDESGTTAAAATSVGISAETAPAPMPPINHPFVFVIREVSSGLILFVGTVNNPVAP